MSRTLLATAFALALALAALGCGGPGFVVMTSDAGSDNAHAATSNDVDSGPDVAPVAALDAPVDSYKGPCQQLSGPQNGGIYCDGYCSAYCQGACSPVPPGIARATCDGTCQGTCYGTCDGSDTGAAGMVNCAGVCAGTCDARCVFTAGKPQLCTGRCLGTCQ